MMKISMFVYKHVYQVVIKFLISVVDGSVSESLFGFHTKVASLLLHSSRLRIKRIS